MKTETLTARIDEGTGELGYCLDSLSIDLEFSVASEGLLIAHDLIEHGNGTKAIGTIQDELEALGGVWFVRGQYGDLRRDSRGSMVSPQESLAYDVSRMARDFLHCDERLPCLLPHETSEDEEMQYIIEIAQKQALDELDQEDIEGNEAMLAEYWLACLPALQKGYAKAESRFKSGNDANWQFWAIADAVQPYLGRVEGEGQQLTLTWGNGAATCDDLFEDFDE